MTEQLTPRQKEIYDYIAARIEDGQPPTVREIGEVFQINSPNGVMCHLQALKNKGLLDWTPAESRSFRLTAKRPNYRELLENFVQVIRRKPRWFDQLLDLPEFMAIDDAFESEERKKATA